VRNKLLQKKAFTLVEVLIAVAIITILMAVGAPMVAKLTKDTKIKELDDYAKTVYLEAQNHLLEKKANGELDALLAQLDAENSLADKSIKYFETAENGTNKEGLYYLSADDALLAEIIPVGSTLDGDFLIEFNPTTAEVHGVFYVEDRELDYMSSEILQLSSRSAEERKGLALGYYGGKNDLMPTPTRGASNEGEEGGSANPGLTPGLTPGVTPGSETQPTTAPVATATPIPTSTPTPTPIVAPAVKSVEVVNGEELYLEIIYDWASTKDVNDFILEVQVEGLESRKKVTLTPDKSNTEMVGLDREVYVLLDSMVEGRSFADIVGSGFKPGENIEITVITKNAAHPTVRTSYDVAASYNSLFASKNGKEIILTSLRHLKNLEKYNPGNQNTKIVLGADIDFKTKDFVWVEDAGGNCVYMRRSDTPRPAGLDTFAPLQNDKIFAKSGNSFDGQNHKLLNFVVTGNSNGVGLFKKIEDMTVSNVMIQDITVNGADYNYVGAFAGTISNSTITNCGVYLSTESVDGVKHIDVTYIAGCHDNKMDHRYDEYIVTGKQYTGGFCGSATDTDFSRCFAAVQVFGTKYVGGFGGSITGDRNYYGYSATVQNCYSSGAVNKAENKAEIIGGFAGYTKETSYKDCYTTSEVDAGKNGTCGGFAATDKECKFVSCRVYAEYVKYGTKKVQSGNKWVDVESTSLECFNSFSESSSDSDYEDCKYYSTSIGYEGGEYSEAYYKGYDKGYKAGHRDRWNWERYGDSYNDKPSKKYKTNEDKKDYKDGYKAGYDAAYYGASYGGHGNGAEDRDGVGPASYSALLGDGVTSYPYSPELDGYRFPFTAVTDAHYGNWSLSGDSQIDDNYFDDDDDDNNGNDGITDKDKIDDVPTITPSPTPGEGDDPTETPEHTHTWVAESIEATCTEKGKTWEACSGCSEIRNEAEVPALGHDIGSWIVDTAAGCETAGTKHKECSRCSYTESDTIPATGHSYKDSVTSPTCEGKGYTTHTCENCGNSYQDAETEALGHNLGNWIVDADADCDTAGTKHKECSRCSYTESETIPATGHSYKDSVTSPTCTEKGYTTHTCERCNDFYRDTETAALGHSWGPWEVTKEASWFSKGTKRRDCSRCDAYETADIDAQWFHSHSYKVDSVVAPTCTTEGYTEEVCSCGAFRHTNETPASGHNMAGWTTKTEATCVNTGLESNSCTKCSHEETREIAATGHDVEWIIDEAATCLEDGHKYQKCATCGKTFEEEVIDALGHDMTGWTVKTAATCETAGLESNSCERCGYEETSEIAATGHSLEWIVEQEATCIENGHKHQECSTCGKTFDEEVVEALGHDWDDGVYTAPTFFRNGFTTYTCDRCGESYVVWDNPGTEDDPTVTPTVTPGAGTGDGTEDDPTVTPTPTPEIPPVITPDDMNGNGGVTAGIGIFYYEIYEDGNGDGRDELAISAIDLFQFDIVNTIVYSRKPKQYGFGVYFADWLADWWFGKNKDEVGDQDGNLDVVDGYTFIVMSTGEDKFSIKLGNSIFGESEYEMVAPR